MSASDLVALYGNPKKLCKRIAELEQQVKDMEDDVAFLRALEGAGVDNWEGYDMAREMMGE